MKMQSAKSSNRIWLGTGICCLFLLLAGRPQCAFAQTNTFPSSGNVGIGTTSPVNALDVGTASVGTFQGTSITASSNSAVSSMGVGQSSTARGRMKWHFDANEGLSFMSLSVSGGLQPLVLQDAGGKVGIGMTPVYSLDVNGGVNGFRIKAASAQSNDTIATFENSSAIQMIVRANGYVGIGTTAPSNLLHLNAGATPPSQLRLSANNAGSLSGLAYTPDNIALGFDIDWNNGWIARHATVASLYKLGGKLQMMGAAGNTVGSPIANWTPYTTLDLTTGNFGIGTTATNYARLSVNKSIRIDDDSGSPNGSDTLAGGPFLYLGTTGGGNAFQFNSGGGLDLWQHNNAAWNRTITFAKTGSVGIGTTSPGYKLDVAGQVRSSSGGFVFPDGTVQATAATGGVSSQWTTSGSNIFYNTGSVGMGTSAPGNKLEVIEANSATASSIRVLSGSASAYAGYAIGRTGTEGYWGIAGSAGHYSSGAVAGDVILRSESNLILSNATNSTVYLKSNGSVGIGTATPTEKLHVAGNGKFTGNLTVDGNINAKYQDIAEWVQSVEQHAPGTVVILDSTKSNEVIASTQAYDTRVAGVISAQPGISLGESGANKVLVATTGRVKVKVDATRAPIQTGDLLVTSDIPGVAMKSEPVNLGGVQLHRPGTLIGKALEPLAKGKGEILVLLSLQ